MKELLDTTVKEVDKIVVDFIQNEKDAYSSLPFVVHNLQGVIQFFVNLFTENGEDESIKWIMKMESNVAELNEAIEHRDTVRIIDVLGFDIQPMLEQLLLIM